MVPCKSLLSIEIVGACLNSTGHRALAGAGKRQSSIALGVSVARNWWFELGLGDFDRSRALEVGVAGGLSCVRPISTSTEAGPLIRDEACPLSDLVRTKNSARHGASKLETALAGLDVERGRGNA